MLVGLLRRLGFYASFKKLTAPAQVSRFLGIDIYTVEIELRLPKDKLQKLQDHLRPNSMGGPASSNLGSQHWQFTVTLHNSALELCTGKLAR